MLDHNPLSTASEGDEESRGSNVVHSQQLSHQKAIMPEVQPEDDALTDQAPSWGQSQGQSSDGARDIQVISCMKLRPRKQQEKTVNNKTHEVEDHEAKAANVEETLANAERHLHDYQSKLKDVKEKLAASKKDSKNFNDNLKSKKRDLAACRRQLKAHKGTVRGLKASNRDLQKALAASEGELTECKDELFSLQAVAQIPDSTISDRFEIVSQQIVNWIDARIATFEKAHPELEPDHVLSVGEDESAIKFLQLYPGAGEHLARNLIHHFLQDNVFGKKVYFFGLLEETVDFLRNIELKMADLDPPKDSGTIAAWRSETLRAAAMTTECKNCCQQQAQKLNDSLFQELAKALPTLFSGQQAHASFYLQVLLPAVKLTNLIRISTSDYAFSPIKSTAFTFEPLTTDMLKACKMIDSKNGKQLKSDRSVVADNDEVIGKRIILLEPGLYRGTKGKNINLRQAMVLVELNHSSGKRSEILV